MRHNVFHKCQTVLIGSASASTIVFETNIVDQAAQCVFAFRVKKGQKPKGQLRKLKGSTIDHNCYAQLEADLARFVRARYAVRDNLVRFLQEGGKVVKAFPDVQQWSQASGHDEHSLTAAPQFRDPAKLDFRLAPGSPCKGKATDGGDLGVRWSDEMWASFLE